MAQLLVRKLNRKVVRALETRAAEHGVSVEEEHRRILERSLMETPDSGLSFIEHLLSSDGLVDEDLASPPPQQPTPVFDTVD